MPSDKETSVVNAIGEFLFILIPLVVLSLVFFHKDRGIPALLGSPEWAFASALLFGQTIVKLVTGIIRRSLATSSESTSDYFGNIQLRTLQQTAALVVAGLIVLALVPAMIVLALILVAEPLSTWLIIAQITLFAIGSFAFIFIGGVVAAGGL